MGSIAVCCVRVDFNLLVLFGPLGDKVVHVSAQCNCLLVDCRRGQVDVPLLLDSEPVAVWHLAVFSVLALLLRIGDPFQQGIILGPELPSEPGLVAPDVLTVRGYGEAIAVIIQIARHLDIACLGGNASHCLYRLRAQVRLRVRDGPVSCCAWVLVLLGPSWAIDWGSDVLMVWSWVLGMLAGSRPMLGAIQVPKHIFFFACAVVFCTTGRSDASLEDDLRTLIECGGIGVT